MAKAKESVNDALARFGREIAAVRSETATNLASVQQKLAPIEVAFGLRPRESLSEKFRKHWKQIVFVYVIPVATLVMTYVLWWIPRQEQHAQTDLTNLIEHQFDQKMRDNKFDELRTDVATLTGQMKIFIPLLQEAVHQELTKAASLPASEFQNNLTRVNVALTAAKLTNASISSSTINDLRSKLIQVSRSTPYYWGTATALVGYRSVQLPGNLPNCFDKTPLMTTQQAIPKDDLSQSPPQEA